MNNLTLGVIIGNRDYFADMLCLEGRHQLLTALKKLDIGAVILPEEEGVYGSIQSRKDALKCAELFKENREDIKGIIISLPNFGDEKSIVTAIRESGLNVPVLVHAFSDDVKKLNYENRRDSFCGKISVCNNLKQYGIKYSLTELHTISPDSEMFAAELTKFTAVCKVVNNLKGARLGLLGIRPGNFNTVRFSEKILERNGISVEPIGLLELVNRIKQLADDDAEVTESLSLIKLYMDTSNLQSSSILKMAKLHKVYRDLVDENAFDAVAFQCWDSIQKSLGINPCTVMSMFSDKMIPSACESDVTGALSMLALQSASNLPSALVDWNNNFADDPNRAVFFHCGNFPKSIYNCSEENCPAISYPEILSSTLGEQNTYGSIEGRIKPGGVTIARVSTADNEGRIKVYLAEGEITGDELDTFGSRGVARINGLQQLIKYICLNGFEHHAAVNMSHVAEIMEEALGNYLTWDVYLHR